MPACITWLLCVLVPIPGRGSRSRTHTLRPRRAIASAAARPTTPPPMIAVSICSIRCSVPALAVRSSDCAHGAGAVRRRSFHYGVGSGVVRVTISRVLVTGASGQLAGSIVRAFADREVIAHTRATLDVTDGDAVRREAARSRPDLIVNCAAFNEVDAAESHATEAFAVNAFAVRSLARAAESCGAVLVHYGSEFVFDGTATEPYDETAPPGPRSVYASSKLVGEWLALEAPRAYVLRVESLFGSPADWTGRRGTLDGIVAGLEAGREVTVFTDRTVSPGYVVDIAVATRFLVDADVAPGIYHCVN